MLSVKFDFVTKSVLPTLLVVWVSPSRAILWFRPKAV